MGIQFWGLHTTLYTNWISLNKSKLYELGDVFAHMISHGGIFKSYDISDCYWYYVDTLKDLQHLQTRFIHQDE